MKITIIGGGNLGTLMAAEQANQGNEVIIQTSKPEKFNSILESYTSDDVMVLSGEIRKATSNWEESISNADLIWVTVPPQLFIETAKDMEPYIHSGQFIGIVPGAGGAEFAFKSIINKGAILFGLARVHSIARLKEYGKSSYTLGRREELLIGSIPASNAGEICKIVEPLLYTPCRALPNYLTVAFTPSNPVLHTCRLYGMFKNHVYGNAYPTNELFYEEWSIDCAQIFMDCSDELQYLCKSIPLDLRDVESVQERFHVRTPEELSIAIQNVDRLKGLGSPVIKTERGYEPDFNSRYFVSDFPYGIKIMLETAKLFGVNAPTMEAIWNWYVKMQPERAANAFELKMTRKEFVDYYMQ